MSGFTLHLQDAMHSERFDDVTSFVGEDSSGSFGILPGHDRILTVLGFGLARFRHLDTTWQFIALPGGVLSFVDNELVISTRRYVRDADHRKIGETLAHELLTLAKEAISAGRVVEAGALTPMYLYPKECQIRK